MGKVNSSFAKKFAARLKEEFGLEVKNPVMGGMYQGYVNQADAEGCSNPYVFQSDWNLPSPRGCTFYASEPFRKLLLAPYLVLDRDSKYSSDWTVYGFKDRAEAESFFKPYHRSNLRHPYDFKHKAQ